MNSIKEQIQALLEGYRQDFYDKVGIHLIVVPSADIRPIKLQELKKITEKFFEIDSISVKAGRKAGIAAPRKFFVQEAINMGYGMAEVARAIDADRTTLYQHIDKLNDKAGMDKQRAGYKQFLYSKI